LYVGWAGWAADVQSLDPTAVEGRAEFPPGLGGPDRESYTIHCAAQILNGDGDVTTARVDAFKLRDLAVGALVTHRGLGGGAPGGLQVSAGGSATGLRQEQGTNGVLATVQFDVEVEAFTNR
jgi:hypothetical protein